MKMCKICKQEKLLSDFHKNIGSEDGHRQRCKQCVNAELKRKRQPSADKYKICNGCGKLLARSEFNQHGVTRDGLRSRCKVCEAGKTKAWRQDNPEKYQQLIDATAKKNREKYASDPEYRQAILDEKREYYAALPPEVKKQQGVRNHVITHHGIAWDDYCRMVDEHDGRCDCCKKKSKLVIDHCHVTHAFRGFLCYACNNGIGNLGDDIAGLRRAIKYLKAHYG